MIGYLKVAFSSLVEEASWMDEETKLQAKKKAAAMKEMTAYPQWFHNDTALDSFYDGVSSIINPYKIGIIDYEM